MFLVIINTVQILGLAFIAAWQARCTHTIRTHTDQLRRIGDGSTDADAAPEAQ